ncbi:MAG: T9SS type A sorting domain-containing protein [Bacteroidia bacterium]
MNRIFFFCLLILCPSLIWAQPNLFSDENLPYQYQAGVPSPKHTIRASPKTLTLSAIQPFFDEFASKTQDIDTNKWFIDGANRNPLKSRHAGKNPPTLGVLSFDGLNAEGLPYDNAAFVSGTADILESHYIDLQGKSASDNIYLSFFLQPQGFGEKPESQDSFVVYFRKSNGAYQRVYYKTGTPLQAFKQIILPVDQADYFHNQFQLKFKSVGALFGQLDVWHLDYVFLGEQRSATDTTFDDVAFSDITKSMLHPYTAVPFQQYEGKALTRKFETVLSNLKVSGVIPDVKATITDAVGGNVFTSGDEFSYSPTMTPFSQYTQAIDSFDNQIMQPYTVSYLLKLSLPPDIDGTTANNRLYELYRIDSLYAYDDGEADGSYGIQDAPKGFANRFTVTSPDTIRAVWISFVPRLNGNSQQVVYMDNYNFRLTIWDAANPNAIAYQQILGSKVKYGDSTNYFHRYVLNQPLGVNGDIWVGLEQIDYWALGVGLDLNYNNQDKIYWDSVGYWVQEKNIKGSLMIRPEFQNSLYHTIVSNEEIQNASNVLETFPNPSSEKKIHLRFPSDEARNYHLTVYDLQGKKIHELYLDNVLSETIDIELPELTNGVYLLQHEWTLNNSQHFQKNEKWLYQK